MSEKAIWTFVFVKRVHKFWRQKVITSAAKKCLVHLFSLARVRKTFDEYFSLFEALKRENVRNMRHRPWISLTLSTDKHSLWSNEKFTARQRSHSWFNCAGPLPRSPKQCAISLSFLKFTQRLSIVISPFKANMGSIDSSRNLSISIARKINFLRTILTWCCHRNNKFIPINFF